MLEQQQQSLPAGIHDRHFTPRILGDGIAMQRDVRSASPIAPEMVLAKMRELDHLSRKLSNVLSDLPALLTMAAPDSLNLLAEAYVTAFAVILRTLW